MYSFRSKSSPFSTPSGFLIKACTIWGIHSFALCPSTWDIQGLPGIPAVPAFLFGNDFKHFLCLSALYLILWEKQLCNSVFPFSPNGNVQLLTDLCKKNLWEICRRIPTPSPVLPSASFPARCSRFSTMHSARSTVWWLLIPLLFTTAPIPQLSCSNVGLYKPVDFGSY